MYRMGRHGCMHATKVVSATQLPRQTRMGIVNWKVKRDHLICCHHNQVKAQHNDGARYMTFKKPSSGSLSNQSINQFTIY